MPETSDDRSAVMTDSDRSIESCVIAFAEFHRHLKFALSNCQKSTIRIGIQIQLGRVQNAQVGLNTDLHLKPMNKLDDITLGKAMQKVSEFFNEWTGELRESVEARKVGWLRMSVNVDDGLLLGWTLSPTFDMKST